jgi:hypothetical protein
MADTNNSLSSVLADFVRLQNNSLETLQQLQQATVSVSETVQISVKENDGTTSTYSIPSFGYLKSSIDRIDNTISKMLGFDGSDAFIRQPDGTYKKIYQAKTPVNPSPIGEVAVPSTFISENNWFFENLMSPALKVSFDVTRYIPQEESKVFVKRMILNISNQTQLEYFQNNIQGKNNINYVNLLVDLQKQGITYFLDEGVNDLPLSVVRYTGSFLPVNYEDRTYTNSDGTTSTKRFYLFDKLTYTDNLSLSVDSMTLKVGDKLIKGETIYEIAEIDSSTRYVRVTRISGYEPIVIGENVQFYSETFSPKLINVGIGYNEYTVVFFRTINDEANLLSTTWSPGIGFFTNDLNISLTTGTTNLKDFYQSSVLDFGNYLLTSARDGSISTFDGLVPNAPVLDINNFQVVQINDHKLDQAEIEAIRKKQSDKIQVQQTINELEKSIDFLKSKINSKKYANENERKSDINKLDRAIKQKTSQSSLYASIVADLNSAAQNAPAALDTPKYRLRGFFQIPNPVISQKTGAQNVIQFITYYRYVRPDGSATDIKQFDYTDPNGSKQRASFSALNEYKSPVRKKIYDGNTGKYVWANEDITNPDVININQIDIPISKGEKVEFYVVSVSEAGWPNNPILSSPSNTISFEFPNDLVTEDEATIALQQAAQEKVKVDIESDLAAQGLDQHLSSSFTANEQYFAHSADVIASNFYTPDGNVISLYQKLQEMQLRIQDLENRLNEVVTPISIFLVDDQSNTKLPVQNGSTVNLFAGYYADQVASLPTAQQRGAILTKTYYLYLQNDSASPLKLISRFPGGFGQMVPYSGTGATGGSFTVNDQDYNNYRKYDYVPIVNLGINTTDTNNDNTLSASFYQSGQLLGQFLYSRYTDVGLTNPIYGQTATRSFIPDLGDTGITAIPGTTASGIFGTTAPWVWDVVSPVTPGNTAAGNGYLTNFCVHIQHPAINNVGTTVAMSNLQLPTVNLNTNTGLPQAPEIVSEFIHSNYFNEPAPARLSSYLPLQLSYKDNNLNITGSAPFPSTYTPSSVDELPNKFGFIDNDRYLIGSQTVGAYLFVGPAQFNQLLVNGVDARSYKSVQPGSDNAIVVPIVFQYRMTDYFGPWISSTVTSVIAGGLGILGGYDPQRVGTLRNLSYTKKIGIDIYQQDEPVFSFDVQVTSTYKKDSIALVDAQSVPEVAQVVENISFTKESVQSLFRSNV